MPDYPLLLLPIPATPARASLPRRYIQTRMPPPDRQITRLTESFSELERVAQSGDLRIRPTPTGYEPERVLVLETVGTLQEFEAAVRKIDGLEWLTDVDVGDITPDEDFYREEDSDALLAGRLFLVMYNQRGLEQLLELWAQYRRSPDGQQFQKGRKKWASLFSQLRRIRRWGPQDRVGATGLREALDQLAAAGEQRITVELELWFKEDASKRGTVSGQLRAIVELEDGRILAESVISEIRYHGILANVPVSAVEQMFQNEGTQIVRFDQLMFVRPTGQVVAIGAGVEPESVEIPQPSREGLEVPPVVALLDGFPMQNHGELAGRLIVDDPDSWEQDCPVQDRVHGTAMASILLRGDLSSPGESPIRPLYVRPILRPEEWPNGDIVDYVPRDVLVVDLVHRAIRRLFEPTSDEAAVAPGIRIVVIAACDLAWRDQLFPSAFARLLDYFAARYGLLFLLACGNQASDLQVSSNDIESGDSLVIARASANAVNQEALSRRLLSPGECLNAITVGSSHRDGSSGQWAQDIVDPYADRTMPSPFNSQGPGFRRTIKPDVLVPGGRQLYRKPIVSNPASPTYRMEVIRSQSAPGIKVASPSPTLGITSATRYVRGTSPAVGYAGYLASQCYDALLQLKQDVGGERLDDCYLPVLVKTMLVHAASWGGPGGELRNLLDTPTKAALTRLLGYGEVDDSRLCDCTVQRATMLGWGSLAPDQAHRYQIPLPRSLDGAAQWRRLTITLASIGPMNPANHKYRRVQMWFDPLENGGAHQLLQVNRSDVDWQAVRRGTVQHEVLEGTNASVFGVTDSAEVRVNCRADAGGRVRPVPYGLAISLEVAPGVDLPICQEVRERIVQAVRIAP